MIVEAGVMNRRVEMWSDRARWRSIRIVHGGKMRWRRKGKHDIVKK